MMLKIAVICFENPFNKPSDGAKNDIRTRIFALQEIDCEIDLYVFNKKEEEKVVDLDLKKYKIKNFYQFEVKGTSIGGLLKKTPISVYKRYTSECTKELKRHTYDVVFYEGEHMSSYRLHSCVNAKKHILRQHDIESIYRFELSKATRGVNSFLQKVESSKYKELERSIDEAFDKFLFISKDEMKQFCEWYPQSADKFVFMPPAITSFCEGIAGGKKKNELLYFGNMELQNNFLSILFFAEKVFPEIEESVPDVRLKVIGKISEQDKNKLTSISSNIEVVGYVDDLEAVARSAAAIVSPVLFGAGVKVKVIDALSYGQVVVATKKAVEGTELINGKHLIVEDDEDKLAKACVDILLHRENYENMMQAGLDFVKSNHSIEHQSEIIRSVLYEQEKYIKHNSAGGIIPKIIHYCWFGHGELPQKERECIESWNTFFPDYEIKLWNEDNFDYNACKFSKQAYELKKYAFVSDYARAKILYEYGGVYLDTDFKVLRDFRDILECEEGVLGFESNQIVGTAIIAVPPKNEVISKLLSFYEENECAERGELDITTNSTLLTDILTSRGLKHNGKIQVVDGLKIYSKEYFYPKNLDDTYTYTDKTVGVHMFSASWLTERQRKRMNNKVWVKICQPTLRWCRRAGMNLIGEKRMKKIEIKLRNFLK